MSAALEAAVRRLLVAEHRAADPSYPGCRVLGRGCDCGAWAERAAARAGVERLLRGDRWRDR